MIAPRRRGRPAALACALGAAVLLAACGGGDPVGSSTSTSTAVAPHATSTSTPPASTSTAEPTTPSPAPTTPAARTLTVVAGGDVLLHEQTWSTADVDAAPAGDGTYDFTTQLAPIAPVVQAADLALCHLETPLAPKGGPYFGYPSFSAPPEIAAGLAATGFDACSFASNHSWDRGTDGVVRSLDGLDAAGVVPYGAAVGDRPGNPTLVDVDGVPVALLSYTYGHNAAPQSGAVETISLDAVLADAATARAAGAQVVVVSAHWGTEYDHEPNAQQLELAPALLASPDVDLVIGHHAHVVQPFEQVGDKWVAYGLGNMLASHATELDANEEGALARFTFTERDDALGSGSSPRPPTCRSWSTSDRRCGWSTCRPRSRATCPPSVGRGTTPRSTGPARSSRVGPAATSSWRSTPPADAGWITSRFCPRSFHRHPDGDAPRL